MTTDNRPPGPTSEPFTGRRSLQGGYRPEIDGLRAIAVISVILFHSGIRLVGGGYVGVDVFFVISGFLITQFIDLRVTTGRFSILEFYERRVRRIVPALTIVLCATSVAAYLLLLPSDLKAFAKSLLATTLFLSNVEFWNQSGYFDAPSVGKPLLHTWSLAVEEQFYIIFPVFMAAAAARFTRTVWCWIVVMLAAGSLALSAWAVVYYPSAAFFLSPTRAWELLLGSLLALNVIPALRSRPINNVMAAVGLILILASVFLYTADTPFPGAFAVPPCLGTALIISSESLGPGVTAIGRLLSLRPIVAVGLISYSAYLWHWPIIVFARYVLVRPFTSVERVSIILACIAVSAASWKIIEQPFRRQSAVCSRQRLFAGTAATAGAFVGLAAVAYIGGGLPYRITAQAALYDAGADDVSPDQNRCLSTMTAERISASDFCTLGPKGGPRFMVWGDSHAGAVMPVIKHLANQMDIPGWFAAQPACPPLLGVRRAADKSSRCKMFNDAVFAQIRESDIPAIILVSRWSVSAMGISKYERETGDPQVLLEDRETTAASIEDNWPIFERGIRRTLRELRSLRRSVYVMIEAPNPDVAVPSLLARQANAGMINRDVRWDFDTMGGYERLRSLFGRLANEFGISVIDPSRVLCEGSHCLVATSGHPLYVDDQHLSVWGAKLPEPVFRPVFHTLQAPTNGNRN